MGEEVISEAMGIHEMVMHGEVPHILVEKYEDDKAP